MISSIHKDEITDEKQLILTLRTAVASSKKTLYNDGILFILWGTAFFTGFLWNYINNVVLVPSRVRDLMTILKPAGAVLLILFTIYYVFIRNKKVRTYSALSTRFVWLGIIVAHNLNAIISSNFLTEIKFELLHPLQMVLIGFALFVTGGIYRYYLLSISGVIMWVAAIIASGMEMNYQYLIRGIADLICFVVPGITMLIAKQKNKNV